MMKMTNMLFIRSIGNAQPAHHAERPQQPKRNRQQRDDHQFNGRERREYISTATTMPVQSAKCFESAFRQSRDVSGEILTIEHDQAGQRLA